MKNITQKFSSLMIVSLTLAWTACSNDDGPAPTPQVDETASIVDIATTNSSFTTLAAALVKADLVSALEGDGPFTVFAPTNEAFDDLLANLGYSSLDDLSAETLTPILLYHVVGGKVLSSDLSAGFVPTLNTAGPGNNSVLLQVDLNAGVQLNVSSNVTTADIDASNGLIHVIDKVLLPPTVVDIAINGPEFSTLVEAVVKADLATTLAGAGPFTVFAPTNAAFEALFTALGVSGIADLTADQLTPILLYHVVGGNVRSTDLSNGAVATLNGAEITVDLTNGVAIDGISSDPSNVLLADVQGSNGVVHVIDAVLVP